MRRVTMDALVDATAEGWGQAVYAYWKELPASEREAAVYRSPRHACALLEMLDGGQRGRVLALTPALPRLLSVYGEEPAVGSIRAHAGARWRRAGGQDSAGDTLKRPDASPESTAARPVPPGSPEELLLQVRELRPPNMDLASFSPLARERSIIEDADWPAESKRPPARFWREGRDLQPMATWGGEASLCGATDALGRLLRRAFALLERSLQEECGLTEGPPGGAKPSAPHPGPVLPWAERRYFLAGRALLPAGGGEADAVADIAVGIAHRLAPPVSGRARRRAELNAGARAAQGAQEANAAEEPMPGPSHGARRGSPRADPPSLTAGEIRALERLAKRLPAAVPVPKGVVGRRAAPYLVRAPGMPFFDKVMLRTGRALEAQSHLTMLQVVRGIREAAEAGRAPLPLLAAGAGGAPGEAGEPLEVCGCEVDASNPVVVLSSCGEVEFADGGHFRRSTTIPAFLLALLRKAIAYGWPLRPEDMDLLLGLVFRVSPRFHAELGRSELSLVARAADRRGAWPSASVRREFVMHVAQAHGGCFCDG